MHIVVALIAIWVLFVMLSWLLHAIKWLLVVALVASLAVVAANIYCNAPASGHAVCLQGQRDSRPLMRRPPKVLGQAAAIRLNHARRRSRIFTKTRVLPR